MAVYKEESVGGRTEKLRCAACEAAAVAEFWIRGKRLAVVTPTGQMYSARSGQVDDAGSCLKTQNKAR